MVAKDSETYRLLERSVSDKIWSLIRDRTDMTAARQTFEHLKETCLSTTLRSKTQIGKSMETHRIKDGETLTDHIATMCRFFRELHIAGVDLDDETKIVKTMCKVSLDWYKL